MSRDNSLALLDTEKVKQMPVEAWASMRSNNRLWVDADTKILELHTAAIAHSSPAVPHTVIVIIIVLNV